MIKDFISKKLEKYRYKLPVWLKSWLLKYGLLEPRREILYRRKNVSWSLISQLSKREIFYEVFETMSNEIYKSIQYANRYNYLPKVNTLVLNKLARQSDSEAYFMAVELYYSPYGYMKLKDTGRMIETFDELIRKRSKEV